MAARFGSALVVACLAALALAVPTNAAFPGANGKIAFYTDPTFDIDVVNPDGSGRATVFANNAVDSYTPLTPAWLADGTTVTFELDSPTQGFAIGGADQTGSNFRIMDYLATTSPAYRHSWSPFDTKVVYDSVECFSPEEPCLYRIRLDPGGTVLAENATQPSWSPDGRKIAFEHYCETCPVSTRVISTMNADGTAQAPVPGDLVGAWPDWSPDGKRLAFAKIGGGISVVNVDGTALTQLTTEGGSPAWSPDGTKIAFLRAVNIPSGCGPFPAPPCVSHIFVMNADGTGQTDITPSDSVADVAPSWQPIPLSYPRPRGASPTEIFLVPAYAPCTGSGNRTHGSPLSFPSCAPPTQTSGTLTVGTPDANGQPAKSFAKVVYAASVGDLALTATISDVRKRSDLSDYTGELSLVSTPRITDKNNGPGSGTVQDEPLPVTISCSPTAATTIGSNCNLSTTVNALYPGAITAGLRSIWQLGQVKAYDGGADGDAETTGDNTLFMNEGIFIP